MVKFILGTLASIILYFSFQTEKQNIVRMGSTIFEDEVTNTLALSKDFKDTIPNDTLFVDLNQSGTPLKYWRKILTEVCIDGECRRVQIDLFWSITGHYLGFRMPNGEFLSKAKHDPFNAKEYDRMHQLLSDPNSALANYTLEELVSESDSTDSNIDAVSSATLTAVLDYIVEGAVYTTYCLWHITYGSTRREAENLTIQNLDSDLVLRILDKGEVKDKIWVLNHIPKTMEFSPELLTKLLELLSGGDIYLAERSLNALDSSKLSKEVQTELAILFSNSDFLQKRLILHKLKEAPQLYKEIIPALTSDINSLNGAIIKALFELLKIHNVKDVVLTKQILPLLKNDNRYIANQAYQFLESIQELDKKTMNDLQRYKKKLQ